MDNRKVTASVILTLLSYIVRGAYPSNGLEYNDDGHTHRDELCLGSYEVRDKRIIRTEDSLNNKSLFVDAIVSDSYENCLSECCKRDIKVCDTTVFIENDAETEENCFLFRCWFSSDDQRCLFSYHEGYRSSVIGGFEAPRFSDLVDLPVQNTNVEEEDEIVNIKFKTTTPPSPTTKAPAEKHVPKKTTTSTASVQQDFVVEHQQCITTQYKCPDSGECIPKRLVCDRYEDCQDKSDEKDCSVSPVSKRPPPPKSPPETSLGKFDGSLLPFAGEESASYSELDDPISAINIDHKLHLKGSQKTHNQENGGGHIESPAAKDVIGEQHIQHLRLLADKQKNMNDLLSMRSQGKGDGNVPVKENTQDTQPKQKETGIKDGSGGRFQSDKCPSGNCPPQNHRKNNDSPKKGSLHPRYGTDSDSGQKDDKSRASPKLEETIPSQYLQYDYTNGVDREDLHSGEPDQLPETVTQKGNTRLAKPHRVSSLDQQVPYSPFKDFPEQGYTGEEDILENGELRGNHGQSSQGKTMDEEEAARRDRLHEVNPHVSSPEKNIQPPDLLYKQIPDPPDRSAMRGSGFDSDLRNADARQLPVPQRFTTDQPRQWPSSKGQPAGSSNNAPPASSQMLNPPVMDSDYFQEWPEISVLYGENSYEVGGDWLQGGGPGGNWQSDPLPPKGAPQQRPGDAGWFNRYDDPQYRYYQPKQRNRGRQRPASRTRSRGGGGAQKPHKGRNRGGYADMEDDYNSRPYMPVQQEQWKEGYPSSVEDQQPPSLPEVIPPDTKSLATTAPPPPQPTPDEQDPGGSITNKVTLAAEQPPLAPSYPPVKYPAEEHIQEVVITEELEGASGAMFPLVVGLLLTFFLLVMVGFRLQYMNRRVRYGRMKTNAHDADYLINGMYL